MPLPLGGNVIRKALGAADMRTVTQHVIASIRYGLSHREEAVRHAMPYARDMDQPLADQFVWMYVNDWTLDYGERGRTAIRELLRRGADAGIIPHRVTPEFVDAA